MHHEQLELRGIVHYELLESIGEVVASFLVRPISNVGHESDSLKLASNTRVNTLGPTPAWLFIR